MQVPAGNKVAFRAYAEGVQIYRWNGTGWAFVGPEAVLYASARTTRSVGIHYAGPTWESNSGSKVVGAVVERCTPDPTAIPWLLLEAVASEGPGIFRAGDLHPAGEHRGRPAPPPTPGDFVGEEVRVPYTADYYFYRRTANPLRAANRPRPPGGPDEPTVAADPPRGPRDRVVRPRARGRAVGTPAPPLRLHSRERLSRTGRVRLLRGTVRGPRPLRRPGLRSRARPRHLPPHAEVLSFPGAGRNPGGGKRSCPPDRRSRLSPDAPRPPRRPASLPTPPPLAGDPCDRSPCRSWPAPRSP